MQIFIRSLLAIAFSLYLVPSSYADEDSFGELFGSSDTTAQRMTRSKLAKKKKAIVIAGGAFYTKVLLWGKVKGSLVGYFYRHPQKPPKEFTLNGPDKWLINTGPYGGNGHRVREVDAGLWNMHDWLGQTNYLQVGPEGRSQKPLASFRIRPGEVLYIGEMVVNYYVDEDKNGKPIAPKLIHVRKNLKDAREMLKREYPNLVKHMKYRPMRLHK